MYLQFSGMIFISKTFSLDIYLLTTTIVRPSVIGEYFTRKSIFLWISWQNNGNEMIKIEKKLDF